MTNEEAFEQWWEYNLPSTEMLSIRKADAQIIFAAGQRSAAENHDVNSPNSRPVQ